MRALLRPHAAARPVRRPHHAFRPRLEPLEDRWVPSGFPVTVNTTGALPATAFVNGNNFVVASVVFGSTSGSSATVVAQRVDTLGNFIGGQIPVASSGLPSNVGAIGAASDGDVNGNFLVAWPVIQTTNGTTVTGARAQLFSKINGVYTPLFTQLPALLAAPQAGNPDEGFARAAMNSHGAFVLAEETTTITASFGLNDQFEVREFTSSGQPIGTAPFTFSNTNGPFGSTANPVVAMDDAGDYVVVWNSSGQLVYQLFNSDSTANSHTPNPVQVPGATSPSSGYSVAMDPAGAFVITWANNNSSSGLGGVLAQRYDARGNTAGGTVKVATNQSNSSSGQFATFAHPQVGADAAGNFTVAFDNDSGVSGGATSHAISAQQFDQSGAKVGSLLNVEPPIVSPPQNPHFFFDGPSLAENAGGSFAVGWDLNSSPPLSNNQQGVQANFFPAAGPTNTPDVTVTKAADQGTINAGQAAGFTVTIKNIGTATANGVTLSDALPGGAGNDVNWQIDTGTDNPGDFLVSGPPGSQLLVLAAGGKTLNAGQSIAVHVTGITSFADAPAPSFSGTLANTATVSATNEPAADQNQKASATVTVVAPDLTVTKTADNAAITAGQTAGFTVTIANQGDGKATATGVILNDPLPAGAGNDVNWVIDTSTGDPINFGIGGTVGQQFLAFAEASRNLTVGQSLTVHITGVTSAADAPAPSGTLNNTAVVTADNAPTRQANRVITVLSPPDVTVSKTTDTPTVDAGQAAHFTVTLQNAGGTTATGVTFSDPLPGNDVSWSILSQSTGNPFSISGSGPGGQSLTFNPTALAAGASDTVEITGITTFEDAHCPAFTGTLTNTATVSAANESAADQNQTASAAVTVVSPEVTVPNTADQSTVSAGQTAGFTVTVSNVGASAAAGVTLSDPLPAGAGNDVNWQIDPGSLNASDFRITGAVGSQVLTLAPGVASLAAGQSFAVHVTGPTSFAEAPAPTFNGSLFNTATVSATNEAPDDQNQQATATINIVTPDVTVFKAADQATVSAGQLAGFTIFLSNAGGLTATGVTLRDPLPAGPGNDVNWQIDPGSQNAAAFVITGAVGSQVLTLAPGVTSLTPGQLLIVHVLGPTTLADAPAPALIGLLANTVTVSAANEPPAAQNQQSSATVTVIPDGVTVLNTADQFFVPATETAGFTVTVFNVGVTDATGVTLNDPLPAGPGNDVNWHINPGSLNAAAFVITGAVGSQVLTLAPGVTSLPAGQSLSVDVTGLTSFADAPAPTFIAFLTSTATVSAANEPATAQNQQSTDTVTVGAPDVTVIKTADQDPVAAGAEAGFTVRVSNVGAAVATGVTLNDPLPAGPGNDVNWQIDPKTGDPGDFVITGAVGSQVLTLAPGVTSQPDGQSFTVHVIGLTTAADAPAPTFTGTLQNTATVGAANEAPGLPNKKSSATITVAVPHVAVTNTIASSSQIDAGQTASFTVSVSNVGSNPVTGIVLSDLLPSGAGNDFNWAVDTTTGNPTDFAISCTPSMSQVLGFTAGSRTLAPGQTLTVRVIGVPTGVDVGPLTSTATVTANNEPVVRATPAIPITVFAPKLSVGKVADNIEITAGQTAGFTVSVDNNGGGAATGAVLSDPLPAGAGNDVNWRIDTGIGNPADFVITGAVGSQALALAPGFTSLPAFIELAVHITGLTTSADAPGFLSGSTLVFLGSLPNTATVSAVNAAPVSASSTVLIVGDAPFSTLSSTSNFNFSSSTLSSSSSFSSGLSSDNAASVVTALRQSAAALNGVVVSPINLDIDLNADAPLPLPAGPPEPLPGAGGSAVALTSLSGAGGTSRVGDISGLVFLDRNGNGVREPGENGIAGLTVYIDTHGDGRFHADDPYAVTNAWGEYVFRNLPLNRTYQVRPVRLQYLAQTYPKKDAAQVVQLSDEHPTETDVTFGTVPFKPAGPPVRPVGNSETETPPVAPQPDKSGGDQSRNDAAFGEGAFWGPVAVPGAVVAAFALGLDRRRRRRSAGRLREESA